LRWASTPVTLGVPQSSVSAASLALIVVDSRVTPSSAAGSPGAARRVSEMVFSDAASAVSRSRTLVVSVRARR